MPNPEAHQRTAGDPVGEDDVDLRQPSLTKPHHQDARGGDDDDYDGSNVHVFEIFEPHPESNALASAPR
jgi:hypothetical protein